jgi:hypothetical protein
MNNIPVDDDKIERGEPPNCAQPEKSMRLLCAVLGKQLHLAMLVFGFASLPILAACDDKPGTTAPQGPSGPSGPQGPAGPQGPQAPRVLRGRLVRRAHKPYA